MRYIRTYEIIKNIKFFLVCTFLTYVLWFQYAFYSISGIMSLLGILLLVLEVLSAKRISYYRPVLFVFGFILFDILFGLPFASYGNLTMSTIIDIVELVIPMIGIFSCIDYDYKQFKKLMIVISIIVFALSISILVKGTASYTGALVIGDLNSNVYSAFILLGVVSTLFLLCSADNKINSVLLIGILVTECIAQVLAASRRGLIVFVFMLLTYTHSLLSIKYKKKPGHKILIILIIFVLFVILASQSKNLSSLVVVKRLTGGTTGGDLKRAAYQSVAWKQFLSSPLWGCGLASVQGEIGVYSHSLYYELLACTGIIGLLFLLLPLARKGIIFWKKSTLCYPTETKMEDRTLCWSILGVFLTGIAVVFIYDVDFYIFVAMFSAYQGIISQRKSDYSM